MLRFATLASAAVLATISTAQAGDRPEFYAQFLGGGSLAGGQSVVIGDFTTTYNLSSAYAAAGAVGAVIVDGLSVELDAFHTTQDLTDLSGYTWSTTSIMGNVKYTLDLNDRLSLYGAVGAGVIHGTDHYPEMDPYPAMDFQYYGLGYQAILGGSVAMTDTLAFVGEIRYQDGFAPLQWENDPADTRHVPVTAALVGLKLSL